MPVFVCRNKECSRLDKKDTEPKVSYTFIDGEIKADRRFCPKCKQEREEINENWGVKKWNVGNSSQRKWSTSHKNTIY